MKTKSWQKAIWYIVYLLFSLSLVISIAATPVKISGKSMYPTLSDKNVVLASRLETLKPIKNGRIITCHYKKTGNQIYVKRVVASAGDIVEIKNGALIVNGVDTTKHYFGDNAKFENDYSETTVPKGEYFVIGDNLNNSSDSRTMGTIKHTQITGVVLCVFYPNFKVLLE